MAQNLPEQHTRACAASEIDKKNTKEWKNLRGAYFARLDGEENPHAKRLATQLLRSREFRNLASLQCCSDKYATYRNYSCRIVCENRNCFRAKQNICERISGRRSWHDEKAASFFHT